LNKKNKKILENTASLNFLNNYTPFYINHYLDFYEKADLSKFQFFYLRDNEFEIKDQNEKIFHLTNSGEMCYCSCFTFRYGIYLCEHTLLF